MQFRGTVAGIPPIAGRYEIAGESTRPGRHRRHRKHSAGRSGGYFRDRFAALSKDNRTAQRTLRLALSDLSPHPWRRRIYVPDRTRINAGCANCTCSSCSITPGSASRTRSWSARWHRRSIWCEPKAGRSSSVPSCRTRCANSASQEFEWRLHREMYLREIDVCSSNIRHSANMAAISGGLGACCSSMIFTFNPSRGARQIRKGLIETREGGLRISAGAAL